MVTKPTTFLNWTDGSPLKVTQPPAPQALAGWTPGEPPPPDYVNWLFYTTDLWLKYLDQTANSSVSVSEALFQARLITGGTWSWDLTSSTLTWSSAFNLSVPSISDADNQASAGSATLADGQVAYVQANIPFTTTATTQNGSNVLTGIVEAQGISIGQTVSGTGIPGSTTVTGGPTEQADGTFNVTLSANATANGSVALTFFGVGALTVSVSDNSALVPGPTTVIIARRSGTFVYVGVNASYMKLRDKEARFLQDAGYAPVFSVTAGESLTQGQAVYLSPGAGDGGRTAGRAYRTDVSVTNGAARSWLVGFVLTSATTGNPVLLASGGALPLFTSLVFGTGYYLDPTTLGGITATKPATSGQYIVPLGTASSATVLQVTPGCGGEAAVVPSASGFQVSTPSLPYTINASTDNNKEFQVDTTSAAGQINLPVATANFLFYVKDTKGTFATNGLTIHRNGSESIEGFASDFVCDSDFGNYGFYCDGTNWFRLKG